jgi:hypothetical protein
MGWGIGFALNDHGRVYCSDGCTWSASASDYEGYPEWPSARQAVLDYFEHEAHSELDMIRDECPGTAAALKEACNEHIGGALHNYARLSDEEKLTLHNETMAVLERDLADFTDSAKDAHAKYKEYAKHWKDYTKKPPVYKPAKTRMQELERLIEPLKLELEMEQWANRYDTYTKNAKRTARLIGREKKFTLA